MCNKSKTTYFAMIFFNQKETTTETKLNNSSFTNFYYDFQRITCSLSWYFLSDCHSVCDAVCNVYTHSAYQIPIHTNSFLWKFVMIWIYSYNICMYACCIVVSSNNSSYHHYPYLKVSTINKNYSFILIHFINISTKHTFYNRIHKINLNYFFYMPPFSIFSCNNFYQEFYLLNLCTKRLKNAKINNELKLSSV